MSLIRQSMLQSYQVATHSWRTRIRDSLTAQQQLPAAVLFYHRVADSHPNSWSINRHDFAKHLDWLASRVQFATLAEIQSSQRCGARSQIQACITFDDGYHENCEFALPELINRNIPCAYFVTTDNVMKQTPFQHDVKNGRALPINTLAQVQEMAMRGIEIGSHSKTHPDFGLEHSRAFLLSEISDSRKQLQDWTGQSIDYFAFPYGLPENMSQAAIDVVIESGYKGFLSAYGAWNWPGEDDYHIQRIHGEPGTASLTNWLTLDPRKLRRTAKFRYAKNDAEMMSQVHDA